MVKPYFIIKKVENFYILIKKGWSNCEWAVCSRTYSYKEAKADRNAYPGVYPSNGDYMRNGRIWNQWLGKFRNMDLH